MKLIYIEWEDAVHNAEWFTPEQAEYWHKSTNYTVRECGWLIKEDRKGITIAGRFKPKDNDLESQFGGLQYIPKPWIKKRKTLLDTEVGEEGWPPMGVSQWREHGKKYKYWDFFKKQVLEQRNMDTSPSKK